MLRTNAVLIAVVMCLAGLVNAEVIFTETFNDGSGDMSTSPSSGDFYSSEVPDGTGTKWSYDDDSSKTGRLSVYTTGTPSTTGWWFISRDLDDAVSNPVLSYYTRMLWGTDQDRLRYSTRFVDDSENGYEAVSRRDGQIEMYRLDAGVATLLGTDTNGPARNYREPTVSMVDGVLTLLIEWNDSGTWGSYEYSVNDDTYTEFTRIDIGGRCSSERLIVDEVSLSGVVPEPATLSLLAIGGVAGLIRKRK